MYMHTCAIEVVQSCVTSRSLEQLKTLFMRLLCSLVGNKVPSYVLQWYQPITIVHVRAIVYISLVNDRSKINCQNHIISDTKREMSKTIH